MISARSRSPSSHLALSRSSFGFAQDDPELVEGSAHICSNECNSYQLILVTI
jgi:hypothetical protein